ncbi:MAG: hypothetical protein HOP16_14085 [Acidobacteria bacterium]|nr:hypothetical protein [Acidobacteriota bacterium]
MTTGRVFVASGCIIAGSMMWSATAQAQSGAGAVVIGIHGADVQGAAAGSAVEWTAGTPVQMDFDILTGPVELSRGAVKDAPYSAEAVNEVIQTLADGNRITRSSTTAIYRDAAGRTRREQGLAIIGPLMATTEQAKQVTITDPEKGVTYVLNPEARTARRLPVPSFGAAFSAGPAVPQVPLPPAQSGDVLFFESTFEAPVPPPGGGVDVRRTVLAQRFAGPSPGVSESLGTQMIEGVLAEGTRSTTTIPAGQIGNERPIEIVSERWFSPELKALVLSKQNDPRFGETVYRLSNIVLGNPEPSLFEVPSDFQVIEGGGAGNMMFRRQLQ